LGRGSPVASASAADVPHTALIHLPLACVLASKLFVEREDGLLGFGVDVACSTSTGAEPGPGLWETLLGERGGPVSGGAVASLGHLVEVACPSSSREGVVLDGWVGLSDVVSHDSELAGNENNCVDDLCS